MMTRWYTMLNIVALAIVVIVVGYFLSIAFNHYRATQRDEPLSWPQIKAQVQPYLPGKPEPSGCSFSYMSPSDGMLICMIDLPLMTLALTSKYGVIVGTSASLNGYVRLGDIALTEGAIFERLNANRSYRWGNLTAHTFTKRQPTTLYKAVSALYWE